MKNSKAQLFSSQEVTILRYLSQRKIQLKDIHASEISEIAVETGIRDKDDVLRALYTLEGKCLVQPNPPGDFTSSRWQVTDVGVKALSIVAAHP